MKITTRYNMPQTTGYKLDLPFALLQCSSLLGKTNLSIAAKQEERQMNVFVMLPDYQRPIQ